MLAFIQKTVADLPSGWLPLVHCVQFTALFCKEEGYLKGFILHFLL